MRLTVELVPRTAWWTNVRSNVTPSQWRTCKQYSKGKTDGVCIICGDSGLNQGRRYPTEAHEIWSYDDTKKIQTLVDIIPICPRCHQCKHLGRSRSTMNPWQWGQLIDHFMRVNEFTDVQTERYLMAAFDLWELRSEHDWELDISFLERLGVTVEATTSG